MMSRSKLVIIGLSVLAGSCGSSGSQDNEAQAPVQSEGQKALHKLDETNRAIALKRAIHASGIQCQRIDRSGYVQEYKRLSMWAASCNDGRGWALFVGRDDSVQVRECKTLPDLKLPRCPEWAEKARPSR
jgi:hypothetical protein